MAAWDISLVSPAIKFDTSFTNNPSNIIELDATHHIVAYSGALTDGFVQVLETNATTGVVTPVTNFEFDTSQCTFPILYKISATKVLCVYKGVSSDGFAVILTIDIGTWAVTAGALYEFDLSNFDGGSLEQIDSTHFLLVWRGGASTQPLAQILTVDTTANTVVTGGALFTIEATAAYNLISRKIDSNHVMVGYSNAAFTNKIRVLEINTSTWDITNVGTPLTTGDTIAGTGKSYFNAIDATHTLFSYIHRPSFICEAIVIAVDPTTYAVTTSNTAHQFGIDGFNIATTKFANIDANHVLITGNNIYSDGVSKVLEVNTGTWAVSEVSTEFTYDSVASAWSSASDLLSGTNNRLLVVWTGDTSDGTAAVFNIELPVVPVDETPVNSSITLEDLGNFIFGKNSINQ